MVSALFTSATEETTHTHIYDHESMRTTCNKAHIKNPKLPLIQQQTFTTLNIQIDHHEARSMLCLFNVWFR